MTALERLRMRKRNEETHRIRRAPSIGGLEIALAVGALGFAIVAWCC